jgi:succinate dehydrogenase / fumarate reductase cytochrome b subunit
MGEGRAADHESKDAFAMASTKKKRPVFFNLAQINLPVGALASIAHRVTGLLLVLATLIAMYLLDLSIRDEAGYARAAALSSATAFRVATLIFIWALSHHLLAGVRHLLMDVDLGSRLQIARLSAWLVNLGGVAVALLVLGAML